MCVQEKICWQEGVRPEKSTRRQSSCASGMSEMDGIHVVRESVRYSLNEWHRSAAFVCMYMRELDRISGPVLSCSVRCKLRLADSEQELRTLSRTLRMTK